MRAPHSSQRTCCSMAIIAVTTSIGEYARVNIFFQDCSAWQV